MVAYDIQILKSSDVTATQLTDALSDANLEFIIGAPIVTGKHQLKVWNTIWITNSD